MSRKDPLRGKVIKDYRLSKKLGGGTFGVVYLAEHVRLRRSFAVKVLHPHVCSDDEVVQRFQREAEALACVDHQNVVQIIDFDRHDDFGFFIVMEMLHGDALSKILKEKKRFSPQDTFMLFNQLLSGLSEVHRQGVVHRDLKPSNLMISERDGQMFLKLFDFGIAAMDDQVDLTRPGTMMGSARYMSPEQVKGMVKEIDARSDLYSCGILLGKILTGKDVFEGVVAHEIFMKHLHEPPPRLQTLLPEGTFSPLLELVFSKALAKEKELRFASAEDFLQALRTAIRIPRSGMDLPAALGLNKETVRDSADSVRLAQAMRAIEREGRGSLSQVPRGVGTPDFLENDVSFAFKSVYSDNGSLDAFSSVEAAKTTVNREIDIRALEAGMTSLDDSVSNQSFSGGLFDSNGMQHIEGQDVSASEIMQPPIQSHSGEIEQVGALPFPEPPDQYSSFSGSALPSARIANLAPQGDSAISPAVATTLPDFRSQSQGMYSRTGSSRYAYVKPRDLFSSESSVSSNAVQEMKESSFVEQEGAGQENDRGKVGKYAKPLPKGSEGQEFISDSFHASELIASLKEREAELLHVAIGEFLHPSDRAFGIRLAHLRRSRSVFTCLLSERERRSSRSSGYSSAAFDGIIQSDEDFVVIGTPIELPMASHRRSASDSSHYPIMDFAATDVSGMVPVQNVQQHFQSSKPLKTKKHKELDNSFASEPMPIRGKLFFLVLVTVGLAFLWFFVLGNKNLFLSSQKAKPSKIVQKEQKLLGASPAAGLELESRLVRSKDGLCLPIYLKAKLSGHKGAVWRFATYRNGKGLLSVSLDRTIRFWSLSKQKLLHVMKLPNSGLSIAVSDKKKWVAVGLADGSVLLIDYAKRIILKRIKAHRKMVYGVDFSADGSSLVTGSADFLIHIWNTKTFARKRSFRGHKGIIYSVRFSKDGQSIYSGSMDKTFRKWNVKKSTHTKRYRWAPIRSVSFSRSKEIAAFGSFHGVIALFDLEKWKLIRQIKNAHSRPVSELSFDKDSKRLASTSWDQKIKIWGVEKGTLQSNIQGHEQAIYGLKFLKSGQEEILLSSSTDQSIRVWSCKKE